MGMKKKVILLGLCFALFLSLCMTCNANAQDTEREAVNILSARDEITKTLIKQVVEASAQELGGIRHEFRTGEFSQGCSVYYDEQAWQGGIGIFFFDTAAAAEADWEKRSSSPKYSSTTFKKDYPAVWFTSVIRVEDPRLKKFECSSSHLAYRIDRFFFSASCHHDHGLDPVDWDRMKNIVYNQANVLYENAKDYWLFDRMVEMEGTLTVDQNKLLKGEETELIFEYNPKSLDYYGDTVEIDFRWIAPVIFEVDPPLELMEEIPGFGQIVYPTQAGVATTTIKLNTSKIEWQGGVAEIRAHYSAKAGVELGRFDTSDVSKCSYDVTLPVAPTANFSYLPENPWVGIDITFDASISSDDGTIEYYNWTFDDDTEEKGGTGNIIVVHNYTALGTYNVTLNVTDNDGLCNETMKTITVGEVPKPILEIPARFKNIHPYTNATGGDAPVFQRKVEKPEFKITNLTAAKPNNVELVIEIFEPKGGGVYASVKNLTVPDLDWAETVQCEWDWSDNSGPQAASNIPIGIYKAKAKLMNTSDNSELASSDEKEFYVIFDYKDSTEKDFVTSDRAYCFNKYPSWTGYSGDKYKLHRYDERIWKLALDDLSIMKVAVDLTSRESVAKYLADKLYITSYVSYATKADDYWPGQNNLWYDNIKALDAGSGTCTDLSALSIGLLRAVGIPARMVHIVGKGGLYEEYKNYNHAFLEVWYVGSWHFFDPTNRAGTTAGTVGSNEYTRTGLQLRPAGAKSKNKGYWVITSSNSPGSTPPVNIYKFYNFNLDVTSITFDNPPSGGYNPGDPMNIKINVTNTGSIDISEPSWLEVMVRVDGYYSDKVYTLQYVPVTNTLKPGKTITKSVTVKAPKKGLYSRYIVARPYTIYKCCNAYTDSVTTFKKKIPGYSISPLYSIDVDGTKKTFQRFSGTFFESNLSDEKAYIKDGYVWDGLPVEIELYSEVNLGRNYSKTIISIANLDSESHEYTFSMPLYGTGDAAYVPSVGTVTSDTTLNVEASHVISYQASGEDTNVSVYEFTKDAKISSVELFEHSGFDVVKADASWDMTLPPGSSSKLSVYSSSRQGQPGFDFSVIYTSLAKEIVDNGDSLMNLKLSAPEEVRVAETMPVNVTVFNNGVVEETITLIVNVSKTPRYSGTPNIIFTDTASISVSPNTAKTISYPVYITKETAATVWDISVDTDKDIGATATFAVNDAFVLDCTRDLEVVHNEIFPFNATISNTWATTVHGVKATIHLFGSFSALEPVEQQIGDLLPNERKTVGWHLNATYVGDLPIEVVVTSDDGGSDAESATITSQTIPDKKTIYVDDDFTDDPANHKWNTIQEGITDANDGDTVLVYTGIYYETVVLNKTLTLVGEGRPTIDASGTGNAITITADNCIVKGFTCVNAYSSRYAGIRVESNNNVIEDNTCNNNDIGIVLVTSSENIIAHNTAKNNDKNGIYLQDSNSNRITDNTASNNLNYHGISLESSNNNEIRDNNANYNHYQGIRLRTSNENIIANNAAENNGDYGIALWTSDANIVANNMAKNNGEIGILLSASQNNEIANNTANSNNIYGIRLCSHSDNNILTNNIANSNNEAGIICWTSSGNILTYNDLNSNKYGFWLYNYSTDNILANNTATSNSYGIYVVRSSNNNIYLNNIIDNTDNAYSYNSNNIWRSASKMSYTYNSKSYWRYLGNYWSDYRGSDTDGDGIGDYSYSIDGDEDEHPLMKPWENYFAP